MWRSGECRGWFLLRVCSLPSDCGDGGSGKGSESRGHVVAGYASSDDMMANVTRFLLKGAREGAASSKLGLRDAL